MILLERVAKAVFHTDGIAQVQSITRPLGTPLDHTSIPFQISAQSAGQIQNLPFNKPRRRPAHQVANIDQSIDILRQQYALQQQANAPPTNKPKPSNKPWPPPRPAQQDRQLRRLLPPLRNYSTGNPTVSTSPSARPALGVRLPRRHRRPDRPTEQRRGQHHQTRRTPTQLLALIPHIAPTANRD